MIKLRSIEELKKEDDAIKYEVCEFESYISTPARVSRMDGHIQFNEKIYSKLNEAQKYFLLKWCYHTIGHTTIKLEDYFISDQKAMVDFLSKGYKIKDYYELIKQSYTKETNLMPRAKNIHKFLKENSLIVNGKPWNIKVTWRLKNLFYIIPLILVISWLIALLAIPDPSGLIHILLVVAIVVFLCRVIDSV